MKLTNRVTNNWYKIKLLQSKTKKDKINSVWCTNSKLSKSISNNVTLSKALKNKLKKYF